MILLTFVQQSIKADWTETCWENLHKGSAIALEEIEHAPTYDHDHIKKVDEA